MGPMKLVAAPRPQPVEVNGDTPAMRLFALLEVIAERDQLVSLQGLVEETGLPKPTLHPQLQKLEAVVLMKR